MLDEQQDTSRAALSEEDIRRIVRSELERAGQQETAAAKAAFIASKGTLDWAYPPLILATTAAASGMDASIFFTFYGLNIIHKDFERLLKVAPLGNPAMPMPVPRASSRNHESSSRAPGSRSSNRAMRVGSRGAAADPQNRCIQRRRWQRLASGSSSCMSCRRSASRCAPCVW